VQAGHRHQVRGSRIPQHAPLPRGYAVAHPHRKRRDDPRHLPIRNRNVNPIGDALPPAVDVPSPARTDTPRLAAAPHVSGGADAAQKQPALVVEAARVHESPGGFEPDLEAPAFSGPKFRTPVPAETCLSAELRGFATLPGTPGPGPRQKVQRLHDKLEAGAHAVAMGHADHHAFGQQIYAAQITWQDFGDRKLCSQRAPEKAGQEKTGGPESLVQARGQQANGEELDKRAVGERR
jgi:hypothetical protein